MITSIKLANGQTLDIESEQKLSPEVINQTVELYAQENPGLFKDLPQQPAQQQPEQAPVDYFQNKDFDLDSARQQLIDNRDRTEGARMLTDLGLSATGSVLGALSPMPGGAILGGAGGSTLNTLLWGLKNGDFEQDSSAFTTARKLKTDFAAGMVLEGAMGGLFNLLGRGKDWIGNTKAAQSVLNQVRLLTARTAKQKQKLVGKSFVALTPDGPLVRNKKEADRLSKERGLKFTTAESFMNTAIKRLQKEAMGESDEFTMAYDAMAQKNADSIVESVRRELGNDGLSQVESAIKQKHSQLLDSSNKANELKGEELERLTSQTNASSFGSFGDDINKALDFHRSQKRQVEEQLYNDIGDFPLVGAKEQLVAKLDSLTKRKPFESKEHAQMTAPMDLINGFNQTVEQMQGPLTVQNLRSFEKRINKVLKEKSGVFAGSPPEEVSKLIKAKSFIDDILKDVAEGEGYYTPEQREVRDRVKRAVNFSRKEVFETYDEGTIGKIRGRVALGEKPIPTTEIADKLIKTGAKGVTVADDYLRAVNNDPAAIEPIAKAFDAKLASKIKDGDITLGSLNTFLSSHKPALERYGLADRYTNLKDIVGNVKNSAEALKDYERSVFYKSLGRDADTYIDGLLDLNKSATTVKALKEEFSDNPAAIKGVKSLMGERLFKERNESVAKLLENHPYDKAINELYSDDPGALKALGDYRDTMKRLVWSQKNPPKGAPDTELDGYLRLLSTSSALDVRRHINLLRGLLKLSDDSAKKAMADYTKRALLDPEYAQTLMEMAKHKGPFSAASKPVGKFLYQAALTLPRAMRTGMFNERDNKILESR